MFKNLIILVVVMVVVGCEVKPEDMYEKYTYFNKIYFNDGDVVEAEYDYESNLLQYEDSNVPPAMIMEAQELYARILKVVVHVDKYDDDSSIYFIVHTYDDIYYIDGFNFDIQAIEDGEVLPSMSPPFLIRALKEDGAGCYDERGVFHWSCSSYSYEEYDEL